MRFLKLDWVDEGRRVHHEVNTVTVLREGSDIADVFFIFGSPFSAAMMREARKGSALEPERTRSMDARKFSGVTLLFIKLSPFQHILQPLTSRTSLPDTEEWEMFSASAISFTFIP